uniref:non-specific serine/threonine protein kinase n=1 Tax=Kryptolebias marmoratus TaxID=37003 RepID=A0A3Q2ZNW6_KRYMA
MNHRTQDGETSSNPEEEKILAESLLGPEEDMVKKFYHTKRVGNYLIGRKLGEGSFAKVREGLHVLTREKVAVKVIDKRKARKDSYVIKNLRREGQIQQMICHPNIAQLLDILETDNSYYLVMELCPGGNLMNHIYDKKCLEERETQKYIRQLVLAVEHLHKLGVVHRDLKIENLLLDEQDNIKLIDFGLSNVAFILGYSDPFSTQCGSPAYAAPELLSRKKYGPKVDVWSIGVNMYAMLTGTLPFTVEPFNLRTLHQKMVDKEMKPLPPSLSTAAICLLKKLLEPDPNKRPNIHQVMADSWLQLARKHLKPFHQMHIEEVNHTVLVHMTEKMGYKHSEVLSAVLCNRACHTLTVYYLLKKKLKRLSTEYRVSMTADNYCCIPERKESQLQEKKKSEKETCEYFQTQWRKHVDKLTFPLKQTPIYLQDYQKFKVYFLKFNQLKHPISFSGLLRAITVGHRKSPLAPPGTVASSSMEYLEIHPLFPNAPQQRRRLATLPPVNTSPEHNIPAPPAPSPIGMHSFGSLAKAEQIEDVPSSPWYKLTNGTLSPPRHVSAFQPDSTIGSPPGSSAFSPPKSAFSPLKPTSAFSPPSNCVNSDPGSPTHRSKFPSMGIGHMLKKKVQLEPFEFRPQQCVEEVVSPPPYPLKTLLCASGALKTLC